MDPVDPRMARFLISQPISDEDVENRRGEQEGVDAVEDPAVSRNDARGVLDAHAALEEGFEEISHDADRSQPLSTYSNGRQFYLGVRLSL